MIVERIISGCQTGADEGGLEAALALGIPTGGTIAYGCQTEDGLRPDLALKYGLTVCAEPGYPPRTRCNVRDSDGTFRFARNFHTAGERCTLMALAEFSKPYFDVDMKRPPAYGDARAWLRRHAIRVLNVAGNAESRAPGIEVFTIDYLVGLLGTAG